MKWLIKLKTVVYNFDLLQLNYSFDTIVGLDTVIEVEVQNIFNCILFLSLLDWNKQLSILKSHQRGENY